MDRFYVYELVDPRDGAVFYVGKGQGKRVRQHVRDAARGRIGNSAKHARIAAILAAGAKPQELIVATFDDEDDALEHEADLIQRYGLENLTNMRPRGAPSAGETFPERVQRLIAEAKGDICRARSDEAVEFHRESVRLGVMLLAKHAEMVKAGTWR